MPELPEVETVRKGLERNLQGLIVTDVITNRADLRFPFPDDLHTAIGSSVTSIKRRAKYLLIEQKTQLTSTSMTYRLLESYTGNHPSTTTCSCLKTTRLR